MSYSSSSILKDEKRNGSSGRSGGRSTTATRTSFDNSLFEVSAVVCIAIKISTFANDLETVILAENIYLG